MKITTVGIDLAKNVFQVHGVDEHGKAVLRKQLRRDQVATFFINLLGAAPPARRGHRESRVHILAARGAPKHVPRPFSGWLGRATD
jgi:transposase